MLEEDAKQSSRDNPVSVWQAAKQSSTSILLVFRRDAKHLWSASDLSPLFAGELIPPLSLDRGERWKVRCDIVRGETRARG